MQPRPLSEKQRQIFWYIFNTVRQLGYQPSVREICADFGIKSPNGAMCHLRALAKKGWIEQSREARAIRILYRPDGSLFDGFIH